jgi:cysteine synthase
MNPVSHVAEPAESSVLSGGAGSPQDPGIGAGFIPGNDTSLYDEVIQVTGEALSMAMARLLTEEGIFAESRPVPPSLRHSG